MIECIEKVKSRQYDSAFCAIVIQDFLWMDNKPLNFDASNLPRSQDLKPIYRETSGVYVFTKDVFLNHKRRIGDNPFIKVVSYKEAVDINNPEDFDLAKALVNSDL
jgi:CMP-N-acetylneuraminic acid synthetase